VSLEVSPRQPSSGSVAAISAAAISGSLAAMRARDVTSLSRSRQGGGVASSCSLTINWNSASGESVYQTYPGSEPADHGEAARRAQQAIQVALDRRDNGGESAAERAD